MDYIEIKIKLNTENIYLGEILIALLGDIDFEGFCEENNTLFAYIPENKFEKPLLEDILKVYELNYELAVIKQKNWNEEWEKNFEPIVIDDILAIIAPFHKQNFETKYKILIEPKMSFGTGHHATTYMLCKLMPDYDFVEKSVLDFGCGTGILGIFASILGAKEVIAVDIDQWAYENTMENAERNSINNMSVIKGDISNVPKRIYDVILANINLNVLKKDIPKLSKMMKEGSLIFFSGYLSNELEQIKNVCKENGLEIVTSSDRDFWNASIFKNKNY